MKSKRNSGRPEKNFKPLRIVSGKANTLNNQCSFRIFLYKIDSCIQTFFSKFFIRSSLTLLSTQKFSNFSIYKKLKVKE